MNVAVICADGSEEIETITIVDILRRSSKIGRVDLIVLDEKSLQITCSRNVKITGDLLFNQIEVRLFFINRIGKFIQPSFYQED
jgi:putative intracellular protease/amidase